MALTLCLACQQHLQTCGKWVWMVRVTSLNGQLCVDRSRQAAAVASSTMINHDLSIYSTSPAPPPETIFWGNLRWRQWERSGRSTLIWVAFWALAFFYVCFARPLPADCGCSVMA